MANRVIQRETAREQRDGIGCLRPRDRHGDILPHFAAVAVRHRDQIVQCNALALRQIIEQACSSEAPIDRACSTARSFAADVCPKEREQLGVGQRGGGRAGRRDADNRNAVRIISIGIGEIKAARGVTGAIEQIDVCGVSKIARGGGQASYGRIDLITQIREGPLGPICKHEVLNPVRRGGGYDHGLGQGNDIAAPKR